MKRKSRKRRRGLHLALALVVLAVFGFFGWLAEGCPTFSRAGAFRRVLRNCALPETKLDVVLEQAGTRGDDIAIGVSENGASVVQLSERTHGWSGYGARYFPSVDGVRYVMMNKTDYDGGHSYSDDSPIDFQSRPAVAVKTDGARAELRLVLEDVTFYPVSKRWKYFDHEGAVGGAWPLRALETKDGWTIFAFDSEVFPEGIRILYDSGKGDTPQCPYEGSEAYWDAFYWIMSFYGQYYGQDRTYVQPARFELTLYDEAGNAAKTVSWKP